MTKDPYRQREARKYENPIASREHILATMEKLGQPASFKRIAKIFDYEQSEQREALRHRMIAMVRDGQLVVDRRNVFAIASRMELITGRISAHPDGFGFLSTERGEDDVFLSIRQMKAVFHGDIAQVRIRGRDRRGRPEGEIVTVVERHTEQLVGRLFFEDNLALIEPLNNRINHEVVVTDADPATHREGQIVVVGILEQPSLHGIPRGSLISVLGDRLTPDMEVEIALRNNAIPVEFPDEVLEETDAIPDKVQARDLEYRVDLREIPFVTIDGEDARDFDDAVYCEPKASGGYRLYVAIADVAHYVTVGSPLDQSAFDRGTSVYFPQYVVPMLPEKLSNGLCSLNPRVDRLAMVCEMTISAQGRLSGYQFYEGVIRSHERLTYTRVAAMLEAGDDDTPLAEWIFDLHSLYKLLQSKRDERGALDFDSTELAFDFDSEGNVASIHPRTRNVAHKIIEECMLCANVATARFITRHKLAGLFRVHEPPEEEKLIALKDFLVRFGVRLSADDVPTPAVYQSVIDQLRAKKNGHVLQMAILRSMNQAVYQAENKGHFGLNYPEYTHFTSPIRRYPDLLVHRLIKSVIHSRQKTTAVYRVGPPSKVQHYPYEMEEVVMLGERCSFTERRADAAVYDVLEWIKCSYIHEHVGDVLEGVITGVAKFGFFVEIADIFVEGLVHISTLAGDYYRYDQQSQVLTGERSRRTYGMGDAVSVQVVRVDVEERKIDFELVTHTPLGRRAPASKPGKSKQKGRRDDKRDSGRTSAKRRGGNEALGGQGSSEPPGARKSRSGRKPGNKNRNRKRR